MIQNFSSIMEVFDWFQKQGFTEEFHLKEHGLWHPKSQMLFSVGEINIVHSIKLEDDSDPDYTTIICAVEIEDEDMKGYFVDAAGSYASLEFSDLKKK